MNHYNPDAYLNIKGSPQTPDQSEYELQMNGLRPVIIARNAEIVNTRFLQVIDETKPVYIVASSINDEIAIWKCDHHCNGSKKNGKVTLTQIQGSDLNVQSYVEQFAPQAEVLIKLRVGKTEYCAGNTSTCAGDFNEIGLDDLLDFVSGEITWEALSGRSWLVKQEKKKTQSKVNVIADLKSDLSDAQSAVSVAESEVTSLKKELTETKGKIPAWMKKIQGISG